MIRAALTPTAARSTLSRIAGEGGTRRNAAGG